MSLKNFNAIDFKLNISGPVIVSLNNDSTYSDIEENF